MQVTPGIWELNLHGMNESQAKIAVNSALRRAPGSVYRIRVIHGYRGGTRLREMIGETYGGHPRVLRLEHGLNPGQTYLVLREY